MGQYYHAKSEELQVRSDRSRVTGKELQVKNNNNNSHKSHVLKIYWSWVIGQEWLTKTDRLLVIWQQLLVKTGHE